MNDGLRLFALGSSRILGEGMAHLLGTALAQHEERARLAERLIASLDEEGEVGRAWIEEAPRRDEELDSGAIEALSLEDSITDLRNRFGW